MTDHCANPNCSVPLRRLNDGRLFQFEVKPKFEPFEERRRAPRGLSHFWLCGQCASTLTLGFDALRGVVVKPRAVA
jgi:hypothetical protein